MIETIVWIIAIISIVGLALVLALTLILRGWIVELYEKVNKALDVLANFESAFEELLDGIIELAPERFDDEDDNFGKDEWAEEESEGEAKPEEEKPVKAKKKK